MNYKTFTFKWILLVVSSILISSLSLKKNSSVFPTYHNYVNDFENILSDEEEKSLNKMCAKHEKETTNQLAIVTVADIETYTDFEAYSLDLAKEWGVGQKDKNNGILICISKNLRKIQIQNGLGIEPLFTNEETKKVIDEHMIPFFKEGDYYKGLKSGLSEIIKELNQN